MSVIVMGDQAVGKTTLMLDLAKSNRGDIQVIKPSYDYLGRFTLNDQVMPTDSINHSISIKGSFYNNPCLRCS